MTDFHSHILPGIDDGCKTVEESIKALRMMADYGVDRVAATPHFYASQSGETPDEFLVRRNAAEEKLREAMKNEKNFMADYSSFVNLPHLLCRYI